MPIKISINIPSLEKEYDVTLPETVTGERLYAAIMDRADGLKDNAEDVYELYSKRIGKKVYPDFKSSTLQELGIENGDSIIVKKDIIPGCC